MRKYLKKENSIFSYHNMQANFLFHGSDYFRNFKSLDHAFIMCDSFNRPPRIWLSLSCLNQSIKCLFEFLCSNSSSSSSEIAPPKSSPISLSSTLSLPRSYKKHIASKIENLVEYSYIPKSAQINESQFPVMSPYHLYKQKPSFTRSIRTLISTKDLFPKSTSSLPDLISVLFKPLKVNNMSLWIYQHTL